MEVTGRIDALTGHPRLALGYEAQFDLARVAPWLSSTTAAGAATVTGEVVGTLDSLTATGHLSASPVAWAETVADRLDAGMRLTPDAIGLDALRRIDSPVGLVRVDYGVAAERTAGEPNGRLFLSLGQAF